MSSKQCCGCAASKPIEAFSKNARKADGLDIYCKVCTSARSAAHYRANAEKRKMQAAAWLAANPGKAAAYCSEWRKRNPEAQRESERRWYEKNRATALEKDRAGRLANVAATQDRERAEYVRNRDARLARYKEWRKKNAGKIAAYAAERRAAKSNRTPPWLTEAQRDEICRLYLVAQQYTVELGIPYHVDHQVPLRGRKVSGLHVPWNLQILPGALNLRKRNRFDV